MRHRESRRRQKLRVKSALMVVLCTALILVFLNGCRSNGNHGELISTSLSVSAYTEARQRANPGAQASMYYFPTLEIFNDAGVLVYRSHESIANAQILKEFPRSVRSLPPQEDAPRLAKILEQTPISNHGSKRLWEETGYSFDCPRELWGMRSPGASPW